ncbi:MAG TPA: sigma-70 family RNA polymerase sigma factor [Thermomicrobiales bacterium]|nr:sigma-70 family RNA polymerase sigma factor [Thermomicrobiales bacterium]
MMRQLRSPRSATVEPDDTGFDDDALVAAAQRDPRAFAPLYARYAEPVYRYCWRRLGDPEAAADATSLVFTKALAALPRYRAGSFRSWLFSIAHNTVVDGLRTARQDAALDPAFHPVDPTPGPEELAVAGDAGRQVRALLVRLSTDQRHVVELRLAGLTDREIAAALGRNLPAVRMLQTRAVARLRTLLAPGAKTGGENDVLR